MDTAGVSGHNIVPFLQLYALETQVTGNCISYKFKINLIDFYAI